MRNDYASITEGFAVEYPMAQPSSARLILFNKELFERLELNWTEEEVLSYLSGTSSVEELPASALAYSGHQFGHFNPTLGDGRAHYLGTTQGNRRFDLQLKGSGATPFSRGGDGLCALGPAVREFVMSQAIQSLGVKTTECLSVITTGNDVYRQGYVPGAVVCRVASSHIRVGSFQYLALQQDKSGMERLLELAIKRHYPQIQSEGDDRVCDFLKHVCNTQISLIVDWLRVGFIHGVMNTDNCLVSGETIDFGPCAMLEAFDFNAVFSSIDKQGRYAFGQQPNIAHWNCARLAESLMLLMACDEEQALEKLTGVLSDFSKSFNEAYHAMWAQKLGLPGWQGSDSELLSELLVLMKNHQLDYTNTFAALTSLAINKKALFTVPVELNEWVAKWQTRISVFDAAEVATLMSKANPAIVPRNELVEKVIEEFYEKGHSPLLEKWLPLLNNPYDYQKYDQAFTARHSKPATYQTFCGT